MEMHCPSDPEDLSATQMEILKLRAKYAWDLWEFHGRQRMNMFNYFLVITGILVNGYLSVLKDQTIWGALSPICLLGIFQCLAFFMIDIRNRKMLYFADDILKELGRGFLFASPPYSELEVATRRDEEEKADWWFRNSKMKYWIQGTYLIIGLAFLALLIYSMWLEFCPVNQLADTFIVPNL